RIQGRYHIEDGDRQGNPSRNGTFVNNQAITSRTALKNNDRIRICDFLAVFLDTDPELPEDDGGQENSSTVEATLNHHSSLLLLDTQPSEKLRLLLEISANLSKTFDLDELLPRIVDSLFHLFKQADRGFVILAEEGNSRLMPKVVK